MWYHLITNIERKFFDLKDTEEYVDLLNKRELKIEPYLPTRPMPGEDKHIPRICLAPSVLLCMKAIGVIGMFRRTLESYEYGKSYVTQGKECYPIIKIEFDDNPHIYFPSKDLVPDVHMTLEHWLLTPTHVHSAEIIWLDPWSVKIEEPEIYTPIEYKAYTTDDVKNKNLNHPWLNGKGHILDSSEQENYND